MRLQDYSYHLPDDLIALYPSEQRSQSRLLCMDIDNGHIEDRKFAEVLQFLRPHDLLVFNDTRVIPARLFGHKQSGGAVELLIERLLPNNRVVSQVRASKSPKPGNKILLHGKSAGAASVEIEVLGREDDFFVLQFSPELDLHKTLAEIGHMPLPPYIKREDQLADAERYQTVYARNEGAVAAPTAGLHFDDELLAAIKHKGVELAFLTLHVGAGTFQPVRVENILEHKMHAEMVDVNEKVCAQVNACKQRGGRVFAVGTTSVRSLESAASNGKLLPFQGETSIFIYPGFEFQIVDALITNFHLPESTLLMLVSAFAEKEMILGAYQHAIDSRYRFFSYGDAMLLHRPGAAD